LFCDFRTRNISNSWSASDGGGLVEHQDFSSAHERFEDFDALLQPDREFAHDRVGIDLERIFLGQMREFHSDRRCASG
jgi:hypothetical protein